MKTKLALPLNIGSPLHPVKDRNGTVIFEPIHRDHCAEIVRMVNGCSGMESIVMERDGYVVADNKMKIKYQSSRQNGVNQIAVQTNHGTLLVTTREGELTITEREPAKVRGMVDGKTLSDIRAELGEWYEFTLREQ